MNSENLQKMKKEQMKVADFSAQIDGKPIVSGSAFGVFPDSIRLDLSDKNEMVAVFKHRSQAVIFGAKMWGAYFIVKPIMSEHFS